VVVIRILGTATSLMPGEGCIPNSCSGVCIHSDGCRVTNWANAVVGGRQQRYEYPRYLFANESRDIIDILTAALHRLVIPWRRPRHNMIAVSRKEVVAALDRFVGPKS